MEDETTDEIHEDDLVEKLFQRNELQRLLARFIEQVQQYPELAKRFGWEDDNYPKTAREELRRLLRDVTDGPWHEVPEKGFGAHRKLCRWTVHNGDNEYIMIGRVRDESNHIKRS